MAQKRDYKKNPPDKLTELNKESMLDFMTDKDASEKAWFKKLFADNKKEKKYNFDTKTHKKGEEYNGYDMTTIRREFAKKYFPKLLEKKKSSSKPSFEDMLASL